MTIVIILRGKNITRWKKKKFREEQLCEMEEKKIQGGSQAEPWTTSFHAVRLQLAQYWAMNIRSFSDRTVLHAVQ